MEEKRLFFGLEVSAPWPQKYPYGRLIEESNRHITLAFLGKTDLQRILSVIPSMPIPSFKTGLAGKFDKCLFLPKRNPRVIAWHIEWLEEMEALNSFQESLSKWLIENEFLKEIKDVFLPHVTLSRKPFNEKKWKKGFFPLPMIIKAIHLYESLGNLKYKPLWTYSLISPFEEIDHTADIAFKIYGENIQQIHAHAQIALAFSFLELLPYFSSSLEKNNLDGIITSLNETITLADTEIGCPLKAVSYHGNIEEENNILCWEMIVDV